MKISGGFDWDQGNQHKNELKHGVANIECEEVFFHEPIIIARDQRHSENEERYTALGKTNAKRLLFVAFTIRQGHVRVISARPMSRQERELYEKEIEN